MIECQQSGRFQALHTFWLSQTFRGIKLVSRTSSVMAFLVALFALTYLRTETNPALPWFQETWNTGQGDWLVSAQSTLGPDPERIAEHLVDADIFSNVAPTFSRQIIERIKEVSRNYLPLNRLGDAAVEAANSAATRQFYLNEKLGSLLIRLGYVSTSLEQLKAQFDALAARAVPIIREALDDIAIEIAQLAANPPTPAKDLMPSARHPLEEVLSIQHQNLITEIRLATTLVFECFPLPVPLYFQDIGATTLQSDLRAARKAAITSLMIRIGEHFRATATASYYGWLKPSLNAESTRALVVAALGARDQGASLPEELRAPTRSFIHMPESLQHDFLDEVTAVRNTIGFSQFLPLNI